jgi:hypothetical protein
MKSRGRNAFTIFELLLVFVVTCAAQAADERPIYPTNFLAAAKAFTNAPATNRYKEASALCEALPITPITHISGNTNLHARGSTFIARDENKPSFFLRENEVLRLLGTPRWTNSEAYAYLATMEEKQGSELVIFFYNGHVTWSTIMGGPNRKPSK